MTTSIFSLVFGVSACSPDEGSSSGGSTPGPCGVTPKACSAFGDVARSAESPLTTTDGAALHPYGLVADPSVIHEGDRYRMWFTSAALDVACASAVPDEEVYKCFIQGTAYTEGQDGRRWDRAPLKPDDPNALVKLALEPTKGGWDARGIETVSVLRGPDGKYRMYYDGHGEPPDGTPFKDAIGLATSSDGITWEKQGSGPVLAPERPWQSVCCDASCACAWGGLLEPSVIYDEAEELYKMWYSAFGEKDGISTFRIGYATSIDGIAWEAYPDPVLEPEKSPAWDEIWVTHSNVIADPCRGYHLYYHGSSAADEAVCQESPMGCPSYTPGSIGHAYSEDGIHWERDPAAAPVLAPQEGSWDGFFVGGPSALVVDGELRLYYFGIASLEEANAIKAQLGLATASCQR